MSINVFSSFNMEGYRKVLFYLQWPTFDQSQFPNHLSYKGGWPLVGSAWGSSSLKSMFGGPISPHFCLHQHCLCKKGGNNVTWRKMTSSWQILTKLVESVSLIDINVWSIYEVIWIIKTGVLINFVFKIIFRGINKNDVTWPPQTPHISTATHARNKKISGNV